MTLKRKDQISAIQYVFFTFFWASLSTPSRFLRLSKLLGRICSDVAIILCEYFWQADQKYLIEFLYLQQFAVILSDWVRSPRSSIFCLASLETTYKKNSFTVATVVSYFSWQDIYYNNYFHNIKIEINKADKSTLTISEKIMNKALEDGFQSTQIDWFFSKAYDLILKLSSHQL